MEYSLAIRLGLFARRGLGQRLVLAHIVSSFDVAPMGRVAVTGQNIAQHVLDDLAGGHVLHHRQQAVNS